MFKNGDVVWMQNDDASWNLALVWNRKNSIFNEKVSHVSIYPFADAKKNTEVHPSNLHRFHGKVTTE